MTRDQQLAVLRAYRNRYEKWSVERCDPSFDNRPGMGRAVKHANWMIHEMIHRIEAGEDKPGQVDRWLGFIQGILWSNGLFTIDEMRKHNTEGPGDL